MSTVLQIEANRRNAQKSTGPRTETGKQSSSMNAFRHGLTAQVVVLPTEDHKAYNTFQNSYLEHLAPVGPIETQLVQTMVDQQWRMNRAVAYEINLTAIAHTLPLDIPDTENPQIDAALREAKALLHHTPLLNSISTRESRLHRQYLATSKHLAEIQHRRKIDSAAQMEEALEMAKHYEAQGLPFEPSQFGFVLTTHQMERFQWRKSQFKDLKKAKKERKVAKRKAEQDKANSIDAPYTQD